MTREDYLKILKLLKSQNFGKIIEVYSPKEALIASLKLGYLVGKCFSTATIAEILDIDCQEVIDTARTILLAYKERFNQIATDEPSIINETPKK